MARSCWACGQQNDGSFTQCVNPVCGLPLNHDRPGVPDTSIVPARPCFVRIYALPATITMVIVLAAVHALIAPKHGLMSSEDATGSPAQRASVQATPHPGPTDPGGPVTFPLPWPHGTGKPTGPAGSTAPPQPGAGGPEPGTYQV